MTDPIYRTVFTVEVFSEGPWDGGSNLTRIAYAIDEGDCIGNTEQTSAEIVPPDQVEAHMLRIGNDGSFFENDEDEEQSW